MKTLVLGLGNSILHDDGVGPRVIQELEGRVFDPQVTLRETSLAGLSLLELLLGFERVIIVDAIQTGGRVGEVYRLTPPDFVTRRALPSFHSLGLFQALELGRKLAQPVPKEVIIIAIEAQDVSTFGEGLTPEVEKAVPRAVVQVLEELQSRT